MSEIWRVCGDFRDVDAFAENHGIRPGYFLSSFGDGPYRGRSGEGKTEFVVPKWHGVRLAYPITVTASVGTGLDFRSPQVEIEAGRKVWIRWSGASLLVQMPDGTGTYAYSRLMRAESRFYYGQ